ncbi:MAG: inositol monophosphatase family protein, partial [Rhodococcus sp. (in: high G+C Gram-positive bacteria)]|uniref:inositol monophosphatase family protein n=1 Tax=Rhodococcus sp. TaxID=1831 RepID=UPI003BB04A4B
RNWDAWSRVARKATRIRILSCSTIDAAFVATGAVDAFVDAGSDTHRLMDIAAAVVLVGASGGAVLDAYGRPIEFDTDLTRRWSGIVAATPELGEELRALVVEG